MNNLMPSLKKAILFALGGLLFAAGGQTSAQTAKNKTTGTSDKKGAKKTDKKDKKKTTLEKKRPEKSSGSK